jgi:hypothetical protein
MAEVEMQGGTVLVRFHGWERVFTGQARLEVPYPAVRGIDVVDNGLRATRGARAGLVVTGFRKIGRWGIGVGLRQLVSVRRGQSALRLRLDRVTTGYDEVLVSLPDAAAVAARVTASTLVRTSRSGPDRHA